MPKKKNYNNEPLPFKLLKNFAKTYPRVWEYCDAFQNGKNGLRRWNELCQIPIAATLEVKQLYPENTVSGIFPAECAALYSWRKYKEIYTFDEDLSNMLIAQADDIEIPLDVLFSLPYPCIWIQATSNIGFFVWFEDDVNTHIMELRIFIVSENDGIIGNYMLHLKQGWTISDGVKDAVLQSEKFLNENTEINRKNKEKFKEGMFTENYDMISHFIQLILYICAENKDVQENEEQKAITSRPANGSQPKDVYREIRKWDVGYRIGNAIRKYDAEKQRQGISHEGTGKGTTKRPHTRRGHYHHYWIGSNKDNSRRIILKWVAPMFINGDEDDIIPTQHNVK